MRNPRFFVVVFSMLFNSEELIHGNIRHIDAASQTCHFPVLVHNELETYLFIQAAEYGVTLADVINGCSHPIFWNNSYRFPFEQFVSFIFMVQCANNVHSRRP